MTSTPSNSTKFSYSSKRLFNKLNLPRLHSNPPTSFDIGPPTGFNSIDFDTELPTGFSTIDFDTKPPTGFNSIDFDTELPTGFSTIDFDTKPPTGFNSIDFDTELPTGFSTIDFDTKLPTGFNSIDLDTELPTGFSTIDFDTKLPTGFSTIDFDTELPTGFSTIDFDAKLPTGFSTIDFDTGLSNGLFDVEPPQTDIQAISTAPQFGYPQTGQPTDNSKTPFTEKTRSPNTELQLFAPKNFDWPFADLRRRGASEAIYDNIEIRHPAELSMRQAALIGCPMALVIVFGINPQVAVAITLADLLTRRIASYSK